MNRVRQASNLRIVAGLRLLLACQVHWRDLSTLLGLGLWRKNLHPYAFQSVFRAFLPSGRRVSGAGRSPFAGSVYLTMISKTSTMASGNGRQQQVAQASPTELQLKFDGVPITQMGGAPADAVISSLSALQRMIHLIGMKSEGRVFGQRVKPSARVRREFSIVCHAPKSGSHIQPLTLGPAGSASAAAIAARTKLLDTLKAFDSGDADILERTIPNARERWFLADAAAGLLPQKESGIEVTLRAGTRGPFAFKADRARALIEIARSGSPPQPERETIVGKIKAIDYSRTSLILQPAGRRSVRIDYPLSIEPFLQANVRRRVSILGDPEVNLVGDVVSFRAVMTCTELESSLPPIEEFRSQGVNVVAHRPILMHASYDFEDRCFVYQNEDLGIDAYSSKYEDLRASVLEELDVLWRNYALAPDEELAPDAMAVKRNLLHRFRAVS